MWKMNQEKQAFLGILACLRGSQYDVHWLLDLYFKLQKKNLMHANYRFPLKCHAKDNFFMPDLWCLWKNFEKQRSSFLNAYVWDLMRYFAYDELAAHA